ncbi:MAG: hypothetical protein MK033_02155 [Candidatus Caenarcaniphilales bacterium]|nr:hypothetical protein [Candidatus Caenarcaniphilales bacterium]
MGFVYIAQPLSVREEVNYNPSENGQYADIGLPDQLKSLTYKQRQDLCVALDKKNY